MRSVFGHWYLPSRLSGPYDCFPERTFTPISATSSTLQTQIHSPYEESHPLTPSHKTFVPYLFNLGYHVLARSLPVVAFESTRCSPRSHKTLLRYQVSSLSVTYRGSRLCKQVLQDLPSSNPTSPIANMVGPTVIGQTITVVNKSGKVVSTVSFRILSHKTSC